MLNYWEKSNKNKEEKIRRIKKKSNWNKWIEEKISELKIERNKLENNSGRWKKNFEKDKNKQLEF